MHGSPPWSKGILIQYHPCLAQSLKLYYFMQYTLKLLKHEENPYYLNISTYLVPLKVQPLLLLYMAPLLEPGASLFLY